LDINATGAATIDSTSLELTASTGNMTWTTTSATGDFNITSGRNINFSINTLGAVMNCTSNQDQDVFKVNNTTYDSKFLIGSATTGFRQTVNNNSYANLDGLGNTEINISTNNNDITLNAGGGNTVTIDPTTMFNFIPTASIITRVVSTVPSGFLLCNGSAVSRTTYSRLYTSIGITFGVGDGSTTFNVPNFQGAFLRGAGNQTNGGVTYTAPAVGTAQQDAVLTPLYASNEGFRDCSAGSRECVSRDRITLDPTDTNTGILPRFDRTATENRPFNYAVYYFIRY